MSQIDVRKASLTDLRQVQDLNYELFLSDQKHLGDLNVDWPYSEAGERYFRRVISGNNGICLVAEASGQIVGYIAGSLQDKHSAYIGKRAELDNMCVTEKMRSNGIGSLLVHAFYEWCTGQDMDYVMVNAFTPNNQALKFYVRNGFEPYSTTLWHRLT